MKKMAESQEILFDSRETASFYQERELEARRGRKMLVLAIIILLLLLFSLGAGVFLVSQRTVFFGRALSPSVIGELSLENSYVFTSPLTARADGREQIRVTVFLLNSEGKGMAGQSVFLGQDERLKIASVQAVTDSLGRAIFDLTTTTPAEYLIEARVANRVLSQRAKVSFR